MCSHDLSNLASIDLFGGEARDAIEHFMAHVSRSRHPSFHSEDCSISPSPWQTRLSDPLSRLLRSSVLFSERMSEVAGTTEESNKSGLYSLRYTACINRGRAMERDFACPLPVLVLLLPLLEGA